MGLLDGTVPQTGGVYPLPYNPQVSDPTKTPQTGGVYPQPNNSAPSPLDPNATYKPQIGTASTADAVDWTVDPNSTVQGRLTGLISQDSDYMRLAGTQAKQAMNQRGLINSSMAVGAGQAAAIGAALPIASQDASTFAQAGQWNAGNRTQNNQFNAGQSQQMTLANLGYSNEAGRYNASNAFDWQKLQAGFGQEREMFGRQAELQKYMQSAQFKQDEAMFGREEALRRYMQSAEFGQQEKMFDKDAELRRYMQTAEFQQAEKMYGREEALRKYMQSEEFRQAEKMFGLDAGLRTHMQSAEFQQQKEMFGEQAALQRYMQSAEFQQAEKMYGREEALRKYMQSADFQQQKEMFGEQAALQKYLQSSEFKQQADMQAAQFAQQQYMQSAEFQQAEKMYGKEEALRKYMQSADFANQRDIQSLSLQHDMAMRQMDDNTRRWMQETTLAANKELTEIGASADARKAFLQQQANALDTYQRMVAQINANPDSSDLIKNKALEDAQKIYQHGIQLAATLAGIELPNDLWTRDDTGLFGDDGSEPPPGSGAQTIEDLYTQILGRTGDQAGMDYWRQKFGDTIDANEIEQFRKEAAGELLQGANGKTYNATNLGFTPGKDPNAAAALVNGWNSMWENPKDMPPTQMPYGGVLQRSGKVAQFTSGNGQTYTITPDTPFAEIGKIPEIAADWRRWYPQLFA